MIKEQRVEMYRFLALESGGKQRWDASAMRMREAEVLMEAGLVAEEKFCPDHFFRMAFRAAFLSLILLDLANGALLHHALANWVDEDFDWRKD